jgi:large subunit ribosomal protein L10
MNKLNKSEVIETLKQKFDNATFFYFIDESTLSAGKTSKLRRTAFERNIQYSVVKNTLIKKALEQSNKSAQAMIDVLHGPTAVFFSENSNDIAKLIKEFRADNAKPELKAAYIDSDIFIGDAELKNLVSLKSKAELLGEVISMLQSPAKNVIGALQASGGQKIAGLLKTMESKAA